MEQVKEKSLVQPITQQQQFVDSEFVAVRISSFVQIYDLLRHCSTSSCCCIENYIIIGFDLAIGADYQVMSA